MSEFPPTDPSKFMAFINGPGNTDKVKQEVGQVRDWLAAERSTTSCGVSGHCWGSTISLACAGTSLPACFSRLILQQCVFLEGIHQCFFFKIKSNIFWILLPRKEFFR